MTDSTQPSQEPNSKPPTEHFPTLTVEGEPVTVLGADLNVNNRTLKFITGELTYLSSISGELHAIDETFTDVTDAVEEKLTSQYRFRESGDETQPWFHTADFWPYTDDASENLFHETAFAYTHPRNTEIALQGIDRDAITYPFDYEKAIAYLDATDHRVHVWASDDSPNVTADVASRVFNPSLNLYVAHGGELYLFVIRAKPYSDPYGEDRDQSTDINENYIDTGRIARIRQSTSITWEATDAEISGDVWETVSVLSRKPASQITPNSFDPIAEFFASESLRNPHSLQQNPRS